jgi:L-fuconolactonase
MMRIDAHQHFWLLSKRNGAWPPPELAAIHRDFLPSQLEPMLKQHGIDATVLVQSLPSVEDTIFMLDLAACYPFIKAVVGWVDMKADGAPEYISRLAMNPKLKGLRPMLQDLPEDDWIADPALAPAVEAMRHNRLSLDALVLPRHLSSLLIFANRYPDIPIVIDHAAKPFISRGELQPWKDDIARLAALPQVHCKLSGMVTEASAQWKTADLQPYADHVLEVFGAQRVMWGSDWPVLDLAADYGRWIDTSNQLLADLNEQERMQVLGLNAQRFYRID